MTASLTDTQPVRTSFDLGPLVDLYRGRGLGWRDLGSLFLPGLLAVLVPLAGGLWRAQYAFSHFGPVAAQAWSTPWFILSSFALVVFFLLVTYRLLLARTSVAIHDRGLVLKLIPLTTRRLTWEQLAGVASQAVQEKFLTRPLRSYHEAVLIPSSGRPVHLPRQMERLPELISRIKASLYPRLLPALQAGFESGQWLFFGPAAIQKESLQIRGRKMPWKDVERILVQQGCLVVEFRGEAHPSQSIPLSQIPNVELLLQLIQQAVKA